MTIGRKLWLGFGTLVLILLATGLVAGVGGRVEQRLLRELVTIKEPVDEAAHEMEINVTETGLGVLNYVSTGDPAYRERVANDEADFERFEAVYDRLSESREEREAGDRLRSLYDEYRALGDDLMDNKDRQSALTARLEEGYSDSTRSSTRAYRRTLTARPRAVSKRRRRRTPWRCRSPRSAPGAGHTFRTPKRSTGNASPTTSPTSIVSWIALPAWT